MGVDLEEGLRYRVTRRLRRQFYDDNRGVSSGDLGVAVFVVDQVPVAIDMGLERSWGGGP